MPKKYMLDTDICSYLIKGASDILAEKVSSNSDSVCMASITLFELMYGAKHKGSTRIESAVNGLSTLVPSVSFSHAAAQKAAEIRTKLEAAGTPVGIFDIMIAATALTEGLVVVTNNIAHFSRIPNLRYENWLRK